MRPRLPPPEELISATARNMAGWHDVSVRALGVRTQPDDRAWKACQPTPFIYFDWIALKPSETEEVRAELDRLAGCLPPELGPASVCDPWARLRLETLDFRLGDPQPWWVRPVGERSEHRPKGLTIKRVDHTDALRHFEAVSVAGFGLPPVEPFSLHAPGVLDDPRMQAWVGSVEGHPVCAAMSFVEAGVVGVYGVATLPEARRHGYGAAITERAMSVASGLPSVLQPSPVGEGIYHRLGYRPFATFSTWIRPPAGR